MAKIKIPETHPVWLRYAASVAAALVVSLMSWRLVHSGLGLHSSLMLTAVVVTAWWGGFGPGLLTLALTIPAQALFREPSDSWRIEGAASWAGFVIYILNAAIICFLFRKRYLQRARTTVSPVAVTGGWMWKLDPDDGGTVETYSPEFPNLSASRTLAMWMESVHPEDRAKLRREIQQALEKGQLTARFHVVREDGEVRQVSMFGVRVEDKATSHTYLVATCIEIGSHENPERIEWQALPLG